MENERNQYEIVKEIAVLSTGDSGYTKEINLIFMEWEEAEKYDIRSFSRTVKSAARESR